MKGLTLIQHIWQEQKNYPDSRGVFSELLYEIGLAGKIISREVNKAGIAEIYGFTGEKNASGDNIQKLDQFTQRTFVNVLGHSGHLCAMASEEEEGVICLDKNKPLGDYVLLFDPLDGSSNIDANVSIGTIFSLYKRISPKGPGTMDDLLQPGNRQVAAGYIVYGTSTMFIYTIGQGVYGFTLDPSIGEFILTHEKITLPPSSKVFSANERDWHSWPEGIKTYLNTIKQEAKLSGRNIGSLVADIHRNLLYGGIFLYPGTAKNPSGKLRLVYEANPMAFIMEQAGGSASNGQEHILNLKPAELHQKTPLYIGNKEEVEKIKKLLK
ncbi:MAG: class 1 fructose-bisphosphatase [Candidatus Komeilibacteria bacterium]|nr:class 1 fructose-bisphosphatase [Candidatus Komeilibacteria bacterium]